MRLALLSQLADWIRGSWRALGLADNAGGEDHERREQCLAEINAIWNFTVATQLFAIATLAAANYLGNQSSLNIETGLRAAVVLPFAVLVLATLKLRTCKSWEPHVRNRLVVCAAAGMGAGLLWLLWLASRLDAGPEQIAGFVAIFGAIAATLIALNPIRAATLSFAGAMALMVALKAGLTPPTFMAGFCFAALFLATCRMAAFDAKRARLTTTESHGRMAAMFVSEFEKQGFGWFWQTNRQGVLTYLSDRIAREVAAAGEIPLGRRLTDVFSMEDGRSDTERTIAFHMSSRTPFSEYTVRLDPSANTDRYLSITGRPTFDELGRFQGFVGSGSDLSERRKSDAEITKLALFDSLTGLANRQQMRLSLDKTLQIPQHGGLRATAMFLLDLDRFKAVNDTLGHQTGDKLLKQVAQRLLRLVGDDGLVGRLGGDEFQVVLPERSSKRELGDLGEAIIASLSQPYFIDGSSITIGCSIGVAIAPEDGEDAETLIRNADLALYAAKADGRGLLRFYRREFLAEAQLRKQLEDDLRQAIAAQQFHLAYQPVVNARTAQIVGYEALVRWDHPTQGQISPAEFIPIAEECGLIESIGEWVLRTACAQAATWPENIRVAVNVSPIQFANPALPSIVVSALANAGLAPARLELEITEGVFVSQSATSDQMFKSLKGIGVRLALDDFGTGYSSLAYLKNAPFDKIKIDQSFVRGAAIPGNRNSAIIKAVVTLAVTLGMETTAEGVELQDEADLVRDLGCSNIQGYFYGRPARFEEVSARLNESGQASPLGHKVSRSPRTTMFRSAMLRLGNVSGEVRIRNISATGALIDGVEFPKDPGNIDVLIELLEGQMFAAKVRWAKEGKAGLEFESRFNVEQLNAPAAKRPKRYASGL